MAWHFALGFFAWLSMALLLWQWLAGRRFPLNRRQPAPDFAPALSLLKPLKGVDAATADCLRSWFTQQYPAPVQLLFAVQSSDDPAAALVRELIREYPSSDAALHICGAEPGENRKVANLAGLLLHVKHPVLVVSDADVHVPPDLLAQAVLPLRDGHTGLVCCLYRFVRPDSAATLWEKIAVNADFWSQVMQARRLAHMDFALGAVMVLRADDLRALGGFDPLRDSLADDFQLGRRISSRGARVELCPVLVECRSGPQSWRSVWEHQLRWARTTRVSRPAAYFFSQLCNGTLWPLLWAAAAPLGPVTLLCGFFLLFRMGMALDLKTMLEANGNASRRDNLLVTLISIPVKDLLQVLLWALAFTGDRVQWHGRNLRVRRDGTLQPL